MRACKKNKAIYFEHGIRLVDYKKCKACLSCVQVCPRNAIEVTSVMPRQVLTVKIEHDVCTMCGECTKEGGEFCPNDLFYIDKVKKDGKEVNGVKFKYKEIRKCQGCLRCESSCPEKAIKPVIFDTE